MNNWITIKTFTSPTDAVVLRSRLEADGIECILLNELTAQVNPFYSNAIGGVQLQVKENDFTQAIEILKDLGYYSDEKPEQYKLLTYIDKSTSKVPYFNRLSLFYRLIILITLIVVTIVSYITYSTLPTTYERLTTDSWCLDYVTYDNKNYIPETIDFIKVSIYGVCDESISFRENGTIKLPGFKSKTIWAKWHLENKKLTISNADSFDFLYNGTYIIDLDHNKLVLKSGKTILNCHTEKNHINFPR